MRAGTAAVLRNGTRAHAGMRYARSPGRETAMPVIGIDGRQHPTTEELEAIIRRLVAEKNAAPKGSARRAMLVRQLEGLRHSYEEAEGIIEEADPMGWGR